jgi:DNA-binding response OmpR family regulator
MASRISGALEVSGYEVTARHSAYEGLKKLYEVRPDLVVIDKNVLLGNQGNSYLRIREEVYVPLIAVGSGDKDRSVEILEMGVDAYMGEPLSLRELVARVHAILRRKNYYRKRRGNPSDSSEHLDSLLDSARDFLTRTEFRLFSCLVMNTDRVLPYTRLIADVWGRKATRDTLHQYIRRLKQKLNIDSVGPYRLLNYRGEGYCFSVDSVNLV